MRKKFIDTENRIQNARRKKGITQIELVDYLQSTVPTVSKMENGRTTYTIETARKIANFLEVDFRYLTYERDYMSFEDRQKETYNERTTQEQALFYLLESYGYSLSATQYYYDGNNYFCGDDSLEHKTHTPIYEVITPNNEIKYISIDTINQLVNDMFVLLDSKLIHNDVRLLWDIEL